MMNKNYLKQLLLLSICASITLPAYADWRSSLANATEWISRKSTSAIANVDNWFAYKGLCMPDTSAIITDIAEPVPMAYEAPYVVPTVSPIIQETAPAVRQNAAQVTIENASVAIASKWYDPLVEKLTQTPKIVHAVWDTVCEYKKPLLWTVSLGVVSACAWKMYKKYAAQQNVIFNKNTVTARDAANNIQKNTTQTNYETYRKFLSVFKEEKKKLLQQHIECYSEQAKFTKNIAQVATAVESATEDYLQLNLERYNAQADELTKQQENLERRIEQIFSYERKLQELDEKSMSPNNHTIIDKREREIAELAHNILAEMEHA